MSFLIISSILASGTDETKTITSLKIIDTSFIIVDLSNDFLSIWISGLFHKFYLYRFYIFNFNLYLKKLMLKVFFIVK